MAFKTAVRLDSRHYNAWYGLGSIYYRQQKYDEAIKHFTRAAKINPCNPVLYCHLANAHRGRGEKRIALRLVNKALQIDPNQVRARFARAALLQQMKRYPAAIREYKRYVSRQHM